MAQGTLAAAGSVVLLPHCEAAAVLDGVEAQHATRLQMGPADLRDFAAHPRFGTARLASLRAFLVGGDQVETPLHERVHAVTGLELTEVCGMTEAYNYAMNPPLSRKRRGSIGVPSHGTELRLVDAHGVDVPAGAVGEILVRSAAVMRGYWNNPDATAIALIDGWLHTGDLARRDADGYYWFVGRRKERIDVGPETGPT